MTAELALATTWRPIETAPSDQRILLFREGEGVGIGAYCDDRFNKRPKPYWSDERGYLGITWMRDRPPTHWMPLPERPHCPTPAEGGPENG